MKVTESILYLLSVIDLTPDEKGRVISSLFVASNNNNNDNNSKEAVPETSNSASTSTSTSTSTSISTPLTTSAATTAVQSDFAPFVGAVLTDRLIDEIGVLQSRLTESRLESENERLVVQITGKNGTPVYSEESFRNAKRYDDDDDDGGDDGDIYLDFDYGSSDGLPLSSLDKKIEIRLGGVVVQQSNIDDLTIYFYDDAYDEENRMQYIHITPRPSRSGPIECVHADIGPLPLGWREEHAVGDDMVLTDFLELVADENNELTPQTLIINGLVFRKKDITGIMSFVTK